MQHKSNEVLWVEKYRPQSIEDTILPETMKNTFRKFVNDKNVPNLLLTGGPGVGKTTIAKAMLDEMGCDYIVKNGSLNVNIDTLRYEISTYASSVSLTGGRKYVIFDEADYLNATSVQPALRNFIEEYSSNCGFIFTCNFKNRIIGPLRSRLSEVDFSIEQTERPQLAMQFFKRVINILNNENVDYDKAVVAKVIEKHFPDFRRVLTELQSYAASGKIDEGIFVNLKQESMDELFNLLKAKNFTEMRKWVASNSDQDMNEMFRRVYDMMQARVEFKTQPGFVVTLADYMYKSNFVADQEINMVAFLTEVMIESEYV
ncbi:MAG: AAA family ATPase [Methylophagaceae bacterium]|jgi:DNA polymerase III delta prime subunit|tara:strand:- start:119 stop:1066 length:948 start_codon:yes stop_codon:yes gene_type:complete